MTQNQQKITNSSLCNHNLNAKSKDEGISEMFHISFSGHFFDSFESVFGDLESIELSDLTVFVSRNFAH